MSDWTTSAIGDCFDLEPGYAFKSSDFKDRGTPIIKIKNVKAGYFNETDFDYVDPEFLTARPKKVAQFDDLLISMSGNRHDGSSETWVGKVAPFRSRKAYLINQRIGALRLKSQGTVDPRFASFLLSSLPYQHTFIAIATSSGGQANLSPTQILTAEMLLPSYSEQIAISNVLGSLDDKIELNRQMNETLETMAQAIFKDWFVDFGPVRRKLAGLTDPAAIMGGLIPARAPELAALFPDGFGEDGLPKGWATAPIKELCSSVANGGTPKRDSSTYWTPGTVPWLTSGEVRKPYLIETAQMISELGLANSSAKWIEPFATVVALYGATAGQVALVATQMTTNQAICALTAKEGYRFSNFLSLAAAKESLASMATGSAQQNLSKGLVENFTAVDAGIDVSKCFDDLAAPLFAKIVANELENRTLAETRDYLLPKLMSGEVRVRDAEKMVGDAA